MAKLAPISLVFLLVTLVRYVFTLSILYPHQSAGARSGTLLWGC